VRVVFLGPPGAGKGTQAALLGQEYGACQVATGDILRKAVQEQTPLGKKAAECIDKGKLVPDDVMLPLVAERLRQEDCRKGFILDGFPRTIAQAEGLEAVLRNEGWGLDGVFCVQVPDNVIIQRLAGRRTCKQCGTLYHEVFNPPKRKDICDRCQGELYQREDDREETISTRLDVYRKQTVPLNDYYRKKGLLREVDGVGDVSEIHDRIIQVFKDAEP
jgi:adenylate kinase